MTNEQRIKQLEAQVQRLEMFITTGEWNWEGGSPEDDALQHSTLTQVIQDTVKNTLRIDQSSSFSIEDN
tara:strand:+ start:483 stop:689 length:207 start_codon:yes stop_codon:yes gene_type:complete